MILQGFCACAARHRLFVPKGDVGIGSSGAAGRNPTRDGGADRGDESGTNVDRSRGGAEAWKKAAEPAHRNQGGDQSYGESGGGG